MWGGETQEEGSRCCSFPEASVSMLTLWRGYLLLLLLGASECCPSLESFTLVSGEAMECWHVSHYVCMWMHTHAYARECEC